MNFTKKSAFTGMLILCYIILCHSSLQAQVMTQQFPREKLLIRLNHIGTLYNKNIVFDTKQVANIEVPALNINSFTIEQTLNATLQTTGLSYKKTAEQSYLIEKIAETKTQSTPSGSGTLRGRIVESETSEPLPGAAIRLSTKQYAVSDFNGYYTIPKVPAGKVSMEVSYVGFKTENTEVTVKNGETNNYDVKMSGSIVLNEVEVKVVRRTRSAVPHTTEKLLTSEIKGLTVVASGISSEQISRSADRNAAQAVQRVSGVSIVDDKFVIVRGLNPRYNLTILNDNIAPSTEVNSRSFALDLIPSRVIDRIIVQKTASPDVQADATGGVVKIYTKDALAVRHFDIDFQLGYREGTSFNRNFLTYNGGKWDFLGFDDGTRKLPSVLPGYGSLHKADLKPSEYAKAFNPTLYYGKKTALPNMQLTANYYDAWNVFGKTLSSLTSFSYKNDNLKADMWRQQGNGYESVQSNDKMGWENRNGNTAQLNLLQNFTYALSDSSKISFKNFILQQGVDNTNIRNSESTLHLISPEGYKIDKDIVLSYNQRFLYAGNLGGVHYFDNGRHKLEWNGGYSYSRQETPDQRVIRLTGVNPDIAIGDAGLQWRARGYSKQMSDDDMTVPLTQGIISRLWSRNSEGVYNGSVDYTFRFTPWLSAKAGTFHQWKSRSMDRRVYTVHEANIADPDVDRIDYNHYVNAELVRFRLQDLPEVWSEKYLNDDYTGLQVFDRTSGSDTYRGTEQNNSAYILLNFTPANRLVEISGGLRYEYNRQKIAAALPPGNYTSLNVPILVDNPTKSWLPSVNLSMHPMESLVFRAAYGKTVNRTEFREVSPFREFDFENNQVIEGNPGLVSAKVDNYDLRLEFYPGQNKGDAISVGVFRKDIDKPIERINNTSRSTGGYPFPRITYRNASSASVKGLEVEVRKSFDFIPLGFFRNLSLIANASWIDSKVKFDDTYDNTFIIRERPLQGQAPYLVNAGLYYDNASWGSKIALIYNTVSENIYAAGMGYKSNTYMNGPEMRGSLIELPRNLLDFSYTQRIGKGLQMKFTVQNILKEAIKVAEDYNFSNEYEKQHDPVDLGTDADGIMRKDYGDNIYSEYNPGRYVSLSISYSF